MPLHPLTEADLELILPWRNATAVCRAMFSHHEITLEEHRAWFERLGEDPTRRWYLFRDYEGTPQGVVYFTEIDTRQGTAFWGFYARPGAPSGTGLKILSQALDTAFSKLGMHKLNAEVLADNLRSLHVHEKVGFTEEGRFREQHHDGVQRIDIVRLGLLAQEWPAHRKRLCACVAQLQQLAATAPPQLHEIIILSDEQSWINPYLLDLVMIWEAQGHVVTWTHDIAGAQAQLDKQRIKDGALISRGLCFCLSFSQILPNDFRAQFLHALVVHESDLPQGKGWSPLTWQILEGKQSIPVTLIEAADALDSGPIYGKRWIEFKGHELIGELRAKQARATHELCRWFVDAYPASAAKSCQQTGEESFYPRRRPADSALDVNKTIAEQFNLLRVVDNERYPAVFTWHGRHYRLKITKIHGYQ